MKTVVIVVNSHFNAAHFRSHLISSLIRLNFRVVVFGAADDYTDQLRSIGAIPYSWRLHPHSLDPFGNFLSLVRLAFLVKRIRADLLLSFTLKANLYSTFVSRLFGKPHLATVTGLGTLFLKESATLRLVRAGLRAFGRRNYVVFQNGEDRGTYLAYRLTSRERSVVIDGSGVNRLRYNSKIRSLRTKLEIQTFQFVYVGRLIRSKGVIDLLEASKILATRLRSNGGTADTPFQVSLYGDFSETDPEQITRAELESFDQLDFIRIKGFEPDPTAIYKDADCVVLPSYREGFPRVLAEASCVGIPMLASNVPGCRAVVKDGLNGFLFNAGDPLSLAEKMELMLATPPDGLAEFGRQAQLISAAYSSENISEAYLELIKKMI